MHTHRITAALATCLLAAGCQAISRPEEPRPVSRAIGYRRVAIVEFYNRTPYGRPARLFTEQLREKLSEWTTSTDVIVIERESLPGLQDPFRGGRISLAVLVAVRERHLADALIIGAVDDHDPYWKPSVHISLKVVDTATAAMPLELSEGWDANRQEDRDRIEEYYRRNRGCDDCRFGPDLFVTSPSYFLRFVADSVAQQLVAAL